MVNRSVLLGLFLIAIGSPGQQAEAQSKPHVYVAPTVGFWKWDKEASPNLSLSHRSKLLLGGRLGYSPIEAFAGEIVILTGSNEGFFGQDTTLTKLRLTQVELSMLVHFQSLVASPVYPFLDLGAGVSFRRGGMDIDGEASFDDSRFVFHLGGGLKMNLAPNLAARFNIRDTFFSHARGGPNQESQVTVDSVELSVAVEYKLFLRQRGSRRLR